MEFQVLFWCLCIFEHTTNVDTNLSHQMTCPEFALVQLNQEEVPVQC